MSAHSVPDDAARSRTLRFDLALQKSRAAVYTASILTAFVGHFFGVFKVNWPLALGIIATSWVVSWIFGLMLRRSEQRGAITALWLVYDIIAISCGVYATGGSISPWYIWYVAIATGAAFASGKRAAYLVTAGYSIAYVTTLVLMGEAAFFNAVFYTALVRMAFLAGASAFFLAGIGNLQEKRLTIRALELEQSRKVEELTRLTEELNRRTEELAEANRQIQEADRLKSQFLANMSHELRTPMNSIIGFSEILVERLEGKIEAKHLNFLKHILASGQHLLNIINDILDLSKIEAGKMEVYPERFAVAPVVESVCHVMRGMSKGQPNFVVEIPSDLPQLEADLAKFKQVLFNLLSNAVKFSPPEAPVTVAARAFEQDGEPMISIAVTDRGIGIDPKDHEVIFEEFRQIDATVKREFGGTGLGLALVKRFIELQGGSVSVTSAPGQGSTFTFTLPQQSRAAVVSRLPTLESLKGDGERVLVVEDDAHAYDLISAALGSAGYLSVRARHGEEAIKLARESRPVAVTLDLVLPGLDGWEVLKKLKSDEVTRDIPVVIISMVDNRDLGVALGADDYFIKPVDRDRLLQRVRQLTHGQPARSRLLLIDDDAAVHALLEEELSRLGYTIESAFTGESGVRVARETSPDVIILDLMMPGMSGFEVADVLKEDALTANIPILVLTSKEISGEDREELQSKVTSFVQKGKSARDQLVREIRRLEQRRAAV